MALAYKHRRRGGSLRMALLLALSAVFLLVLRPVIFQVAQVTSALSCLTLRRLRVGACPVRPPPAGHT